MLLRLTSAAVLLAASASLAFAKPVTLPAETNLRQAPGTKSALVTAIPKGSEIEVGDCDAGWCKATFNGQDGYVIERNLSSTPRAVPRQPQQADMQKLRHGYEQYFGADIPADQQPQQRRYGAGRGQQQQQYYNDDDDTVVASNDPANGYVPVAPGPYYYAPRYVYPYPGPYYYGYGYRPYGYWRRW